ncbi:MAG: hypothetical protein BWY72_00673 [Bacteroidetes bacterium ADurb.Bin416]|nr:MAG: hypothetical protein BWY72_00673 [Bacteroidetes bacterium ADurb.Bin416]
MPVMCGQSVESLKLVNVRCEGWFDIQGNLNTLLGSDERGFQRNIGPFKQAVLLVFDKVIKSPVNIRLLESEGSPDVFNHRFFDFVSLL